MTKSRTAPALLLPALALAAPAKGQAADPETVITRQREQVRNLIAPCPRAGDGEEIVVCGRRRDEAGPGPDRLPLPVAREPGARIRGESPPMRECLRLCYEPLN